MFCRLKTLLWLVALPWHMSHAQSSEVDISAIRSAALKKYSGRTIVDGGDCKLEINITPADREVVWSGSQSLLLESTVRPERRNNKIHTALKFKRVCEADPQSTAGKRSYICKEAVIDCEFAQEPVPPASCIVGVAFKDVIAFSPRESGQPVPNESTCRSALVMAGATGPAPVLRPGIKAEENHLIPANHEVPAKTWPATVDQ